MYQSLRYHRELQLANGTTKGLAKMNTSPLKRLCRSNNVSKYASARHNMYQVWGANTDVGKSILSAGLLRSFDKLSLYIKPVQTGAPIADDSKFVNKYAKMSRSTTLVSLEAPVSPDLACDLSEVEPIGDEDLQQRIHGTICRFDQLLLSEQIIDKSTGLLETAGGVLSPVPSGQSQADFYRSFRLPGLLVGDSKLGGISTTLSAYEALRLRGYDVPAIVLIPHSDIELENERSIERGVDLDHTTVFLAPSLPPLEQSLEQYFGSEEVTCFYRNLLEHMHTVRAQAENALREMQDEAPNILWYPFTQHKQLDKILCIDSAHGTKYSTFNQHNGGHDSVTDAFGSWWTTGVGHGNARMARTVANAAGRYGHVGLPGAAHEKAFELSKRMLEGPGKNWASRVFFSDNGSTAMEVALKMALRMRATQFPGRAHLEQKIVGVNGCYHGDTLGVMDCAPHSDYNQHQTPWYTPRGLFFDPPTVCIVDGVWTLQIPPSMTKFCEDEGLCLFNRGRPHTFESRDHIYAPLRNGEAYCELISAALDKAVETKEFDLAALVLEPVMLAAGGMRLVDPAFQRALIQESRRRQLPVVFDEVFSGLWRLGVQSGAELLCEAPDIAAYSKLLTGGTVPLAVTLANAEVFDAFYSDHTSDALLHGHSYTGHAIGCAAAVESLKMYEELAHRKSDAQAVQYWDRNMAKEISTLNSVVSVSEMGTVLAVELNAKDGLGYSATGARALQKRLMESGVMTRPLGNILYVMVPPLVDQRSCNDLSKTLYQCMLENEEETSVMKNCF